MLSAVRRLASVRVGPRGIRVGMVALFLLGVALLAMAIPVPSASGAAAPVQSKNGKAVEQSSREAAPVPLADDEVLVGAYIQNIQVIDPATNSYLADVYVWYRWTNPELKPYKTVEVMNWYEAWQMMELGHQTKPSKQTDGSFYFAHRYTGAFNSPLSLVKFPFGTQQLTIVLEDFKYEQGQMRFVADEQSTAINSQITLPGYNIGTPTISISDFSYGSDFGDLDGTPTEIYSRATVSVPVSNPGLPNVIKYLVPLVLIVATASLVFYLPPTEVEGRIALGITALLTLVAMEWSATESLPTVSYLTMLDVLYLIGILFILASLILGIRTSWMAREGGVESAIHSDDRMLYIFLGSFAVVFGAVMAGYLLT